MSKYGFIVSVQTSVFLHFENLRQALFTNWLPQSAPSEKLNACITAVWSQENEIPYAGFLADLMSQFEGIEMFSEISWLLNKNAISNHLYIVNTSACIVKIPWQTCERWHFVFSILALFHCCCCYEHHYLCHLQGLSVTQCFKGLDKICEYL